MKSILVALESERVVPSVLTTAYIVAQRFGSHLDGLNLRPVVRVSHVSAGIAMPDMLHRLEMMERENSRKVRQPFDAFMRGHGVGANNAGGAGDGPTAGWTEGVDHNGNLVGMRGRGYDLVIVGRPQKGEAHPTMAALESALFHSGRPVLIAPPTPPRTLGDTVIFGWNDSVEAARTLAASMPLLHRAQRVLVMTVGNRQSSPDGLEQVVHGLQLHGITAEPVTVPAANRSVGEALLGECAERGADLLVMGAYSHSRLREFIFGGATEHILHNAELPVLMTH